MHVCVDDLELYLRGDLSASQTAEIHAHLADCPACDEQLCKTQGFLDQLVQLSRSQSTYPSPLERRNGQRVSTNDPALIRLIYPTVSIPLPARILDVSKGGLKVEVSQVLEAGMTVSILLARTIAIGEVRYCIPTGAAYHAGLSIQDVFSKSGSPERWDLTLLRCENREAPSDNRIAFARMLLSE